MELTTVMVLPYIGGQIEIQGLNEESYIYRGEIEDIWVAGEGTVEVHLEAVMSWFAHGEGFPPIPTRWRRHEPAVYRASLLNHTVNNIGPGTEGGDRLKIELLMAGELVILFPPDGSKLDPARIEEPDAIQA